MYLLLMTLEKKSEIILVNSKITNKIRCAVDTVPVAKTPILLNSGEKI